MFIQSSSTFRPFDCRPSHVQRKATDKRFEKNLRYAINSVVRWNAYIVVLKVLKI